MLALLAAAFAAVAVLVVLVIRMLTAGAEHLDVGGPSLVAISVGFAFANAAALLVVTRTWAALRPTTLLLTVLAAIAWPLSGHALLAAPVAVLLVGLLVDRDRRVPGQTRLTSLSGALALATMALFAVVAGAITSPVRLAPTPLTADETTAPERGSDDAAWAEDDTAPVVEDVPRGGDDAPPTVEDTPRVDDDAPAPAPAARHRSAPPGPATSTPGAARLPSAASFVRAYYADLDAQRFAEAWKRLTPGVQAALGPYARWKAGYAETISSRPRDLTVSGGRTRTTVTHILVARNKGCDGARRFSVTWQLRAVGSRWTVASLGATVAGPQEC